MPPPRGPPPVDTASLLRRVLEICGPLAGGTVRFEDRPLWAQLRGILAAAAEAHAALIDAEKETDGSEGNAPRRLVRFAAFDGSALEPAAWNDVGGDVDDELEPEEAAKAAATRELSWRVIRRASELIRLQRQLLSAAAAADAAAPLHERLAATSLNDSASPPAGLEPRNTAAHRRLAPLVAPVQAALATALAEGTAALQKGAAGGVGAGGKLDKATRIRCGRLRACASHLQTEIDAFAAGDGRIMGRLFSERLRSAIRLQLRRSLEAPGAPPRRAWRYSSTCRAAAVRASRCLRSHHLLHLHLHLTTTSPPYLSGVGFLKDVDSAARVLSNALYERHTLESVASSEWLRKLLATPNRPETKAAVKALPESTADILLRYIEAHAALTHLTSPGSREVLAEAGEEWERLMQLVEMAAAAPCAAASEVHFLPLRDLAALRKALDGEAARAFGIRRLFENTPHCPGPAVLGQRLRTRPEN